MLDLTYVELPDGQDELLEAMAENAHDMWARERQSEGWTYGPERNDQLLETPDMVPYAPVDTHEIELPPHLDDLIETMAKNVHEVWAQTRQRQGWVYGQQRDDARKWHPCLVPYEELTDDEREYDRNTAVETLKLIMKMGFTIQPAAEISINH